MTAQENNLKTKADWETTWKDHPLPYVRVPVRMIKTALEGHLPKSHGMSFLEVGCAPGGFMAYFHQTFGWNVSGFDYAGNAVELTKKNMDILNIPANVWEQNLFAPEMKKEKYDVVFSAGFIEHFEDTEDVVRQIQDMSKRYVVTIVPNIRGINGVLHRIFRPKSFSQHVSIVPDVLEYVHGIHKIRTLYCGYVGALIQHHITHDIEWFKKHPTCKRIVNTPVGVINRALRRFPNLHGKSVSSSILYIGEKI